MLMTPMVSQAETAPALPDRCLNLAGDWRLLIGGPEAEPEHPVPTLPFAEQIELPATTETAGKGPLNPEQLKDGLTAVRKWEGTVWYEREFTIPETWRASPVRLFVERSKWTALWLDGQPLGIQPLLCTPHEQALGILTPGVHRLTLCVDNRKKPAPGDNHQVSLHTQGNWNGLLGRLELQRSDALRIASLRVRPNFGERCFELSLQLEGRPHSRPALLLLEAESFNHPGKPHLTSLLSEIPAGAVSHNLQLPLGEKARAWDEFSPALYRLHLRMEAGDCIDERVVVSGLRDFRREGTSFNINGRRTFLRGEVNCCVFPLTGHAPMKRQAWLDYYGILQAHGLNHVRFHSWTPPEAAFAAADELGIYLLTELPFWGKWTEEIRQGLLPEGEAILRQLGHHPSLVMLSLGNEHQGEREPMRALVEELRRQEPALLIAQGANNYLETPSLAPEDDFWISARLPQSSAPKGLANIRGSFSTNDGDNGHLQVGPGGTRHDYSASLQGVPLPVISHEIGQFTTLPDFNEISRYTGVFESRNLRLFRDKAEKAGLLPLAASAHAASGRLAALLYREEIEAALRTSGMAGFELLGLQDFPGQGTALVGLYNAFMDSKGCHSPEEFRRFCAPEVLLARFDRHTWSAGETFSTDIDLANYGPGPVPVAVLHWQLYDQVRDLTLAEGSRGAVAAPQGSLTRLGKLSLPLPLVEEAVHVELRLELRLEDRCLRNHYPLWIYPAHPETEQPHPDSFHHFSVPGPELLKALAAGDSVLLTLASTQHPPRSPGGAFTTDFWCWPMFRNRPGTMGLLIQPGHPALAGFPTTTHSDWQWFHLARAARPADLGEQLRGTEPIVRVLDNLERCQQLALLFEARVGPGRLLFCGIDLPSLAPRHPEARQLLHSLQAYAASPAFLPRLSLPPEALPNFSAPRPPGPPRTPEPQSSPPLHPTPQLTYPRRRHNLSPIV